ncbi:MAG: phosphoribosylanthranilate isomerase [Acidobacteria bacterium]|nr:phosphoribosylanthranilate isomerase [Acidobacteriota bacterium]
MVHVKICGIRHAEDAAVAVEAGASALGFNFWSGTPRYIAPEEAARIIEGLEGLRAAVPRDIWRVGVFVDEALERVLEIAAETGISVLQLHGSESPEYLERLGSWPKIKAIIKALRVSDDFQPEQLLRYRSANAFLLDGFVAGMHGGTGKSFDWTRAEKAASFGKIILAGGLNPDNVGMAVRQVRPWGVDVCSGVEITPGKKDPQRIWEFIQAVRAAEAEMAASSPARNPAPDLLF